MNDALMVAVVVTGGDALSCHVVSYVVHHFHVLVPCYYSIDQGGCLFIAIDPRDG